MSDCFVKIDELVYISLLLFLICVPVYGHPLMLENLSPDLVEVVSFHSLCSIHKHCRKQHTQRKQQPQQEN